MRSLAVAGLASALALLLACSDRAPAADAASERRAEPLARDGSAAREITSIPDRVKVQLDLAAVRAALRAYRAERGAWPGSMSELSVDGLNYPADLVYEPAAGTVASRTYPTL